MSTEQNSNQTQAGERTGKHPIAIGSRVEIHNMNGSGTPIIEGIATVVGLDCRANGSQPRAVAKVGIY